MHSGAYTRANQQMLVTFRDVETAVILTDAAARDAADSALRAVGARVLAAGTAPDEVLEGLTGSGGRVRLLICDAIVEGGASALVRNLWSRSHRPFVLVAGATSADLAEVARTAARLGLIAASVRTPITPETLTEALTAPLTVESLIGVVNNFAHDASGLVLSVGMISELLVDSPGLTPSQARDVRNIHKASRDLTELIKRLRQRLTAEDR